MVDGAMGDVHVIEDPIRRALSRWRQHMEARVAGQCQFHGGPAQCPADDPLVRVPYDEPKQRARGLLGRRVGPVGADEIPADLAGR